MNYSIILPCEKDRAHFLNEWFKYIDENSELIIVSRTLEPMELGNIKIINYSHEGEYFNPAKALNLGVKEAKSEQIYISCPEIEIYDGEIFEYDGKANMIFEVFDQNENGSRGMSLVNSNYRCGSPMMYFLAKFIKEDILDINGWDEDFMNGYAYEDNDFGERFNRAGKKFMVIDGVNAVHRWHARGSLGTAGAKLNQAKYMENNRKGVTYCENGINKKRN
jgi:hypothetical protein